MGQVTGEMKLGPSDSGINEILRQQPGSSDSYTRHFSQSEDFFLRLSEPIEVPSFSIHHDVNVAMPDAEYLKRVRSLIRQIHPRLPELFSGLTYSFDPADVLRPAFYQIFRVAEAHYLYLMRLDLVCRPQYHDIVERGTNDATPVYRTRDLIVDVDLIPLKSTAGSSVTDRRVTIEQLISDTWIGETGRGYFVQGIWLDTDLTKFFTRLFLPRGKRMYPYYPFSSKYRTVCHHPISLNIEARRAAVPMLHNIKEFLRPHLDTIEQVLRERSFSESLQAFEAIRREVPESWQKRWEPLTLSVYLNDEEQKEFEVHEREGAPA
jgi:hypothetical protein